MAMNLLDRSNYFKGLLLLVGKDKNISKNERDYLMQVGKVLSFEPTYCKETIDHLLENKYIVDEAPVFSNENVAKMFVKDSIKVAFSDESLHFRELEWLVSVVNQNKLSEEWLEREMSQFLKTKNMKQTDLLEIQKYLQNYKMKWAG